MPTLAIPTDPPGTTQMQGSLGDAEAMATRLSRAANAVEGQQDVADGGAVSGVGDGGGTSSRQADHQRARPLVPNRVRTRVVLALLLASGAVISACSSDDPEELPGGGTPVSSSNPITKAQASSVRNAGRAMTLDYVRRLSATEADIDDARSLEEWENCTASQESFTFHPTQNGVVYTAVVYVDRPPMSDDEVKARFRDAPTKWKPGDDVDGTNGVFRVRADGQQQPFFFQVSSPCYYFGDVDGISLDEQRKVTGFISRKWDE